MRRLPMPERADWRGSAERMGFRFHHMEGMPYWDETACIAFTLEEVECDLEAPAGELHAMCLDLVDQASGSEALMERLRVPAPYRDLVASSWRAREPSLLGRMDFAYGGQGPGRLPAKLLEYNADTPTSLFEAAVFQWTWLEEMTGSGALPQGADQFNSLHEALVAAYRGLPRDSLLHFTCDASSIEDHGTIAYMMDCALQGGQRPKFVGIDRIGVDARGRFTDEDELVVDRLSKLYPWEWMFADGFGPKIPGSGTRFVEPPWKALISSKAILPVLWEAHEGHPNLLPAYFGDDERAASMGDRVRKPVFSREGANTSLILGGEAVAETAGPYGAEGFVHQAAASLFRSEAGYALVGAWIVGGEPHGVGIREDASPITGNLSRFLPHVILEEDAAKPGSPGP